MNYDLQQDKMRIPFSSDTENSEKITLKTNIESRLFNSKTLEIIRYVGISFCYGNQNKKRKVHKSIVKVAAGGNT